MHLYANLQNAVLAEYCRSLNKKAANVFDGQKSNKNSAPTKNENMTTTQTESCYNPKVW